MEAKEIKKVEGHEIGALLLRAGLKIVNLEAKLKEAIDTIEIINHAILIETNPSNYLLELRELNNQWLENNKEA